MQDKSGRTYLKLADAKAGQRVELDDGFTCVASGVVVLQANAKGSVFFPCEEGEHHIHGQADDGIHCVGIYPLA